MTKAEALDLLKDRAFMMCAVDLCDMDCQDCHKALYMAIEALEEEPSEDCISRADWLHEAIRCEVLCTNHMKSDMGCDGGCQYDTELLKRIDKVIDKVIGARMESDEE